MQGFTSAGRRIGVEWFPAAASAAAAPGPAILMLHGADGLAFADGYRLGARLLAASGIAVAFVHYLDRTGGRGVTYSTLRASFPAWAATVGDALGWLAARPEVDAGRLGIVGVSLGAALALDVAAGDRRVKAVVDYFGPVPDGLAARRPTLPPTLILHGAADPIVPVAQARDLERLLKASGTPYEMRIYPGQGHGLVGPAQLDSASRVTAFLARHLVFRP